MLIVNFARKITFYILCLFCNAIVYTKALSCMLAYTKTVVVHARVPRRIEAIIAALIEISTS